MVNLTTLNSMSVLAVGISVFLLIILFYFLGLKARLYLNKKHPDLFSNETNAINGTLLGLLGLLLAFTFSMSSSRYDARRDVIIEEANDISTAILRTDLYPDS